MTDDVVAVGEQRLVGWSVLVELLVLLIRLGLGIDRPSTVELLSLREANQSSIATAAMIKPIGMTDA